MGEQSTLSVARTIAIDEMSFSLQAAQAFDWALDRLLPADSEIELAEFVTNRERREQRCPA